MRSLYAHLSRQFREIEPAIVRAEHSERAVRDAEGFYPLVLEEQPAYARAGAFGRCRVAVVGGGFAGLTAAWWLSAHGFTVRLFEAAADVGGRVRSRVMAANQRVSEHGAELIGRNHPTWLRLARRFRLPLTLITDSEGYDAMGLRTPMFLDHRSRDAERVFGELESALRILNDGAAGVNPLRPWDATDASVLDRTSVADWISTVTVGRPLVAHAMRFQLENMQACPVEEQSLLGLLAPVSSGLPDTADPRLNPSAYWDASEVFRCGIGNDALAHALRDSLPGDVLRTGCRVTRLQLAGEGCDVTVENARPDRFEWVVLAAPPAHWPAAIGSRIRGVAPWGRRRNAS